MKTVLRKDKAIAQIRKNMTASGCTEEHIEEAVSNYIKLYENGVPEIAVLS